MITMAFAKVLRDHIDGIVKSQYLGCMLQLTLEQGGHEMCSDPVKYVHQFFDDAMMVLEDAQVCAVLNEKRKEYPKLTACQ